MQRCPWRRRLQPAFLLPRDLLLWGNHCPGLLEELTDKNKFRRKRLIEILLHAINQKLNNFIALVKANNLSSPALLNIRWEYESDIFICNGSLAEVIYDFDVILFPVSSLGRLSLWWHHVSPPPIPGITSIQHQPESSLQIQTAREQTVWDCCYKVWCSTDGLCSFCWHQQWVDCRSRNISGHKDGKDCSIQDQFSQETLHNIFL